MLKMGLTENVQMRVLHHFTSLVISYLSSGMMGRVCFVEKWSISSEIYTSANQKSYRSELQTGLRCKFVPRLKY